MFVVKKNIVLARTDGGAPGLIKLEYFGGRTTGEVKTHCPEGAIAELMVDGRYFSAPAASRFNLPYPLTSESRVTARIVKGGAIIALSSPAPVFDEAQTGEDAFEESAQEERDEASVSALEEKEEESAEKEQEKEKKEQVKAEKEQTEKEEAKQENAAPAAKKTGGKKGKNKGRDGKAGFLDEIKENLEELFAAYPKQENLEKIIPNSAWVSVTGEGGEYVVGVIADEDGKARYLCYGVPDKDNSRPPSVRPECRGWLPVEEEGAGYWVMYQDINSGEIIMHI